MRKFVLDPSGREYAAVRESLANGFKQAEAFGRLEVLFSQVRNCH